MHWHITTKQREPLPKGLANVSPPSSLLQVAAGAGAQDRATQGTTP